MKAKNPILLTALLVGWLSTHAATYYVSSISGNDSYTSTQAQSQSTPWKTLAKVNSFFSSLNPGDQVLLQAGSVFTGPLLITKSGTGSQFIKISTYGTGAAPIISGFANLVGWTNAGGNIWQSLPCTNCGLAVNMVEIADTSQYMGRYPNVGTANGGYAQVQSFNGTTSITDSHLGSGPNWTGAQLVLRKNTWVMETDNILSQSGSTITYQNQSIYTPTVKFGYFIQNSPSTLDVNGEWYYNPSTKKMSLYSTTNPSSFSTPVQASMVDTLLKANYVGYVQINGISFQGANKTAMSFYYANQISVTNCTISFSGVDGIDGLYSNYVYVEYANISNTNSVGVSFNNGNGNEVLNCQITKTGVIPGECAPLNSEVGVYINGNSNVVQNNTISHSGYSGIDFMGTGNTIANNYINYFMCVKDDGGGIYTFNGQTSASQKHLTGYITGNIIDSGMANLAGTDSTQAAIAQGIYLDENTTECYVTGNTITGCTGGIFFQDAQNCSFQHNTLYHNSDGQLMMRHDNPSLTLDGNDVSYNINVTNVDTENNVIATSTAASSGLTSFAYIHNNYYAQVLPGTQFYNLAFTDLYGEGSFGSWQGTHGEDVVYSTQLPLNFSPYTVNSLIGSDLYTRGNITTPFSSAATGTRVVVGNPVGTVVSGSWYVTNFTMTAPDATHTMIVFLEATVAPSYPIVAPYAYVPILQGTNNYSVVWKATGSTPVGSLVFQIANTEPGISVTNITLYQANVTVNNPNQNVIFQYNPTKSSLSLNLSGTYQDATGATYSGTVTIPAYGSVLLFKKT